MTDQTPMENQPKVQDVGDSLVSLSRYDCWSATQGLISGSRCTFLELQESLPPKKQDSIKYGCFLFK